MTGDPHSAPASVRQTEAADPRANTWLGANAGSGKTRVLIDRVARLLLDGTAPQRILCLTYTKAAAGEMQNRLFARLGAWAMLEEGALRAQLAELGALDDRDTLDGAALARARRLFARAIETPGGLKIQTIHAFCAGLLRRFPLEAGVSPGFTEVDTRQEAQLLQDAAEGVLSAAPQTFDRLAAELGGADLSKLLGEIVAHRDGFARPLDREAALARFDLPEGFDIRALLERVFVADETTLLRRVVACLRQGSTRDVAAAETLTGADLAAPSLEALEILERVFLFGPKAQAPFAAKIGQFPTNASRVALGDDLAQLEALMARVEAARPARLALRAAERTATLHGFAAAFLPLVEQGKRARGWLGFDDLIDRARALLDNSSVAQWVLYKLDGGVDHILVDEAQDTSPAQWAVIERLADEMAAGDDGRGRTLFVVGDRKQSIYSFQGADLEAFDAVRERFRDRLVAARRGLNQLTLEHSFRSSQAVLTLVDRTFADGLGLGGPPMHIAYHPDLPGRVDLWPALEPAEAPSEPEWWQPVDVLSEEHAIARLARHVAGEVARMLDSATPLPRANGPARPIRPGDILILVRRRNALFHRIIAECKTRGLPIAGADVMKLGAELAVRDLTALLAFLATPEDDLALATVLRAPLGGWSEADLFALAHDRNGVLWSALRARATRDAACAATLAWLRDLRDAADFLRPHDLLERALTRHGGRARLVARLGPEAEDGIDALLAQALAFEAAEVPSLTGFLGWLSADAVEIRRRADGTQDLIRVMTVHGAKGLEAPVVILPDTADRRAPRMPEILKMAGTVAWSVRREHEPAALAAARSDLEAARAQEDARLLYVAMTRAECWLIIAAAGATGAGSWHARLRAAMDDAGAVVHDFPTGRGLRHGHAVWPDAAVVPAEATTTVPQLPDWASQPVPPVDAVRTLITPSALGGAKVLDAAVEDPAALEGEAALRRGRRLHLLLEHLPHFPVAGRRAAAADLLAADGELPPDPDEITQLMAEATAVLDAPELAFLWSSDALSEVDLTAELGGARMIGTVDRLIVTDTRILAVDWKSNLLVPERSEDVPEGLLRQMGAYAHALAAIWPDRPVETALLWTRRAQLMPLPPALVAEALARGLREAGIDP
ncbi:MAG: double-strand break repair helicase AddA [Alkalilacustris sp.]